MRLRFIQPVQKAKTPRTPKRLQALTNQMNKANQVGLLTGIRKFKARVEPHKVFEAWKSGNYQNVLEQIPWTKLHDDLTPEILDSHRAAMQSIADFAIPSLPAPTKESLRFDTENSRISKWINTRSADLVMNIDQTSRQSIQQAVSQSFNRALTPRQVADTIKGSIGLLPQHERAVGKFRDSMLAKGKTLDQATSMAGSYAERLLDWRAMTIARTETKQAINRGQLVIWQDASSQGLLGRGAQKVWVVDGRPCETCEPMDGVAVGLDEPWVIVDEYGSRAVMVPTDSHPNCMCDMTLEIGDTEQSFEDNQPEEEQNDEEDQTE